MNCGLHYIWFCTTESVLKKIKPWHTKSQSCMAWLIHTHNVCLVGKTPGLNDTVPVSKDTRKHNGMVSFNCNHKGLAHEEIQNSQYFIRYKELSLSYCSTSSLSGELPAFILFPVHPKLVTAVTSRNQWLSYKCDWRSWTQFPAFQVW
jgi:hypothetical protein